MTRSRLPRFLSTAGLVLAGGLPFGLLACGAAPSSDPAAPPPVIRARLVAAEPLTGTRRVEIAGVVEAARSATVSSRVMASVVAVHADLGDSVAAGAALLSIDPAAAQGQVAQAEGGLAQAQGALALATRNLERFRALAETQSASALELDLAKSQHAQAQGAVLQAQGAVAGARAVARESRVVAPFAGRVTARMVEVGDLVAPGRPLVTIESGQGRRLRVEVPEALVTAAAIATGQAVTVRLDARPDLADIAGRIAEVSPGPDPQTHAYTVKIELPEASIAAGSAGKALLEVSRETRAAGITLPTSAVLSIGGLDLVVIVGAEGQAISRAVTLGATTADGRVEILSGLDAGERVADGLRQAPGAGTRIEEAIR